MECGDDDPERLLDDIDELFELINEVCVTNEEGAILSLKVHQLTCLPVRTSSLAYQCGPAHSHSVVQLAHIAHPLTRIVCTTAYA